MEVSQGGDERPSLKDVYPGERRGAKARNILTNGMCNRQVTGNVHQVS